MNFEFDEVIQRTGTNSLKYDFCEKRGKPVDALPLWVADMDFKAPPAVINSLVDASHFGIFGYSETSNGYFDVLQKWFAEYFGWNINSDWLVKTPGVVFAICMAIRALTNKGDAILIQPPVYYPFAKSVVSNKRKLVNNSLEYVNGKYSINFEDFENKIIENNVKLFILCSPHNPVGRVWTPGELTRLGDICLKYGVYVVSDEIHADFVFKGHQHSVFSNLKPEFADISVTCTAPSKSFNLAGLQVSNIFISNQGIKKRFEEEIEKVGYSQINQMGLIACQTAYRYGRQWLANLKQYLAGNLAYTRCFLAQKLPQIKLVEPDGTYLLWLDFRELGLDQNQLENLVLYKAKLWLDSGTIFGSEGEGFERINIACPRATLIKALSQLDQAVIRHIK